MSAFDERDNLLDEDMFDNTEDLLGESENAGDTGDSGFDFSDIDFEDGEEGDEGDEESDDEGFGDIDNEDWDEEGEDGDEEGEDGDEEGEDGDEEGFGELGDEGDEETSDVDFEDFGDLEVGQGESDDTEDEIKFDDIDEIKPEINQEDIGGIESLGGFNDFDSTQDLVGKSLDDMTEEEISKLSSEELEELMLKNGLTEDTEDIDTGEPGGFEVETVDDAIKRMESIGADQDGSILHSDSLMTDNFDTVSKDTDFISDTGQIVVMDTSETGENFKFEYIDIENIAIVKRIRKNTTNVEDLIQSIKSTGLLEPLVVAPTATEGVYVLLAGFRRIMACAKAGKRKIPCIVNIKANIPEIPVLEALYNHSKSYTIREIVDYIEYLEKQKGIMSASMIEYLLQLNSGDYTKLKDILNDNDEDIVSKLFDGIYTIEMAFKKLEQRRKKESAEEKDNKKAARVYEDEKESGATNIAGSGEEAAEGEGLSEDELKSLAFNAGDLDEVDNENLQDLVAEGNNIEGFKPHVQDVHNREYIDPALKKAVLQRDGHKCQCCGFGEIGTDSVLDFHHIVPVFLGNGGKGDSSAGSDSMENGITLCLICHALVHSQGFGQLNLGKIEDMTPERQTQFKKIIKLGNVIREGMAKKGMKLQDAKKEHPLKDVGRRKPGTQQSIG